MTIHFATCALLFVVLALAFWVWQKTGKQVPALPLTRKSDAFDRKGIKSILCRYKELFFWLALLSLAIALSSPKVEEQDRTGGPKIEKNPVPREGIALYFLIDRSGSMDETVVQNDRVVKKIDVAKTSVLEFVKGNSGLNLPGRENDLVGLIAFARAAEVISPLTLDKGEIARRLERIEPVHEDVLNGTAIGYAIFKAVNIIEATKYFAARQKEQAVPVYDIKNQVLVVITDGLQSPNPADKTNPFRYIWTDEAIRYAKEKGVRVYFIGVDPIFANPQFAQEVGELKSAVQNTGGAFFLTTEGHSVEEILTKIDSLEKSVLPEAVVIRQVPVENYVSVAPLFALFALLCLAIGMILETTVAKTVP